MSLELTATLKQVLPPVTGESKNGPWSKQDFVVETPGDYPKKVCCTMWGDKANMLQNLSPGQEVKVFFDVESREYNGRWYTDVKAWKIEAPQSGGPGAAPQQDGNIPPLNDADIPFDDDDSGLPF